MNAINPEVDLIEKAAVRVGMKSLMNHGAASCVYSEGCSGVSQAHLIAFAREVALHCAAALATPPAAAPVDAPVQQAGEVPPSSGAERGLSDAEQRMLGFLFANMEDLSDKDWRDHGFRAATFNSLELKVRSTFMARRAALKGEQPVAPEPDDTPLETGEGDARG